MRRVSPGRLIALREREPGTAVLTQATHVPTPARVRQQARDAHRLCSLRDGRTLDVVRMADEEIAREVMHLRGLAERSLV
jgi:hypothetical protein